MAVFTRDGAAQFVRSKAGLPLVSVLLPTRGRPKLLVDSVRSIYENAKDKSCVEFLLKVDLDDQETIAAAHRMEKTLPLRTFVTSRGNGYRDMHLWVNELCAYARGDWLYLWNDDALMLTRHWDELLESARIVRPRHSTEIAMLITASVERPDSHEFSFVRRTVYQVLGHMAVCPHVDNWLYDIFVFLGAAHLFPLISVSHAHGKLGDETWRDVSAYYDNQTLDTSGYSEKMLRAKIFDLTKLVGYISSND